MMHPSPLIKQWILFGVDTNDNIRLSHILANQVSVQVLQCHP